MGTKKKMASCRSCLHLGVSHYDADPSVKWNACMHPDFKETFTDGRALDLELEPIAPWCPKPEPRPPSAFEIMLAQQKPEPEPDVVIPEQECACALCGVLDALGFPDVDEEEKNLVVNEPELVVSEHEVSALDGREREVEVSSEDGIFGKSPW